jgi:hypothetical protein
MYNAFKQLLIQQEDLIQGINALPGRKESLLVKLFVLELQIEKHTCHTKTQIWSEIHKRAMLQEKPDVFEIFLAGLFLTTAEKDAPLSRLHGFNCMLFGTDMHHCKELYGSDFDTLFPKMFAAMFERSQIPYVYLRLTIILGKGNTEAKALWIQQAEQDGFHNKFNMNTLAFALAALRLLNYDSESFWLSMRGKCSASETIIADGLSCNGNNLDKACEIFRNTVMDLSNDLYRQSNLLNPHLLKALRERGILKVEN